MEKNRFLIKKWVCDYDKGREGRFDLRFLLYFVKSSSEIEGRKGEGAQACSERRVSRDEEEVSVSSLCPVRMFTHLQSRSRVSKIVSSTKMVVYQFYFIFSIMEYRMSHVLPYDFYYVIRNIIKNRVNLT